MEKTPYQQWLDNRLISYPVLGELAWKAALTTAIDEVNRQHYPGNPAVKNVIKILENLAK